MSRPDQKNKPSPDYVPAETRRVRINGRDCVEVDGGKWVEMLRDAAWWAKNGAKNRG